MKKKIITSSRQVGMRDINVLLSAPISRIKTLRDDKGRKGFTLIELLVVVLIIGILAAVALPQYQKAVEKSRIAGEELVLNTLSKAIDLWVLENGLSPSSDVSFLGTEANATLDIEIPWEECRDRRHCRTKYVVWEASCFPGFCNISADSLGVENSPINFEGAWENEYDGNGWVRL